VLNAGAVTFHGVTDDFVYRARRALGDPGADRWLHAAESAYRRIGARWWQQQLGSVPSGRGAGRATIPAARRVRLRQEADGSWSAGDEDAAFSLGDMKGLHYIRYLVERPGEEVDALTLYATFAGHGGVIVEEGDAGEVADATALTAYRRRLGEIDAQLDAADRRGDQEAAASLHAERGAIVAQLRAATGLGGRPRRTSGSAERARVAVRKAVAAALAQVGRHDPGVARLLRDSVRTGTTCRSDPNPDHPVTWITT
jgi:hypothetical protein